MNPSTIEQAINYYFPLANASDQEKELAEKNARLKMIEIKWGKKGQSCPYCLSRNFTRESNSRDEWKCKNRKSQMVYSIKTNTIMEGSNLKLGAWLCIIWALANKAETCRESSIAKLLNISTNSLLPRIREIKEEIEYFRKNSIFDTTPEDYENQSPKIDRYDISYDNQLKDGD